MTATATFDHDEYLRTLSQRPGVYRMLDAAGDVIYVGKARSLKNRVSSYFRGAATSPKVEALRRNTTSIEVTVTETEAEALLLECNLIKRHRPRFNVTLRDDKSYPYIHLESDHAFPRLAFYRGSRQRPGRFFGPYPSAWAVRDTLNLLQKLFLLRSCTDSFFANRSRPCLQYQIKRCSAPCVAYIGADDYAQDVGHAVMFLEGEHEKVVDDLVRRMEAASTGLEYERAAAYRDQIAMLRRLQEQQAMAGASRDADVIAAVCEGRMQCVAVMSIRSGRNLGTRTYFPASAIRVSGREVLVSFLGQYYLSREAPREVLTNLPVGDCELLEQGFAARAGHKVEMRWRLRGLRAQWVKFAQTNAEEALRMRLTSSLARAHRVLRREPHDGRIDDRVLRRLRRGRCTEEPVSAFQRERRHARGRLRRAAPGAHAPLHARQAGRGAGARPAAHRRRQGSGRGGGACARGAAAPGHHGRRRRERSGAQTRTGAAFLVGP
jgi:excinuclease ABC subunit C